jgi:hypothetical protein
MFIWSEVPGIVTPAALYVAGPVLTAVGLARVNPGKRRLVVAFLGNVMNVVGLFFASAVGRSVGEDMGRNSRTDYVPTIQLVAWIILLGSCYVGCFLLKTAWHQRDGSTGGH